MTAPAVSTTPELRRAVASQADIATLQRAIDALTVKVQIIQDAVPALDLGETKFDVEWQVKMGDGRWVHADADLAAKMRRQGAPVRQRRVTEWTEVEGMVEA